MLTVLTLSATVGPFTNVTLPNRAAEVLRTGLPVPISVHDFGLEAATSPKTWTWPLWVNLPSQLLSGKAPIHSVSYATHQALPMC